MPSEAERGDIDRKATFLLLLSLAGHTSRDLAVDGDINDLFPLQLFWKYERAGFAGKFLDDALFL